MTTSAVLSFCPDLRDPNAKSLELFRVSIVDSKLTVGFLHTPSDLKRLGVDALTSALIASTPWTLLPALLESSGEENFFSRLVESTRHSSVYVSRLEPC